MQKIDLLISHRQIQLWAREFNYTLCQWGKKNLEQGAVIHKDIAVFDPIIDEPFGANVILEASKIFTPDPTAERIIVFPFFIQNRDKVEISSVSEAFKIDVDLEEGLYRVYYEICEGLEGEEIYYKFTFVPGSCEFIPHYTISDSWGGQENKLLSIGYC
ncbi:MULTISPECIES: competence protein ComJ [Pseudomonas]|uniref:Competence protein J (ComJ) n=2 Tax=Pseudomonas luteola TaxID=47886 RepID=A0ABS0MNW4_PSELU|nr:MULTISPECIES: competence protein ComJ [Pseudomonas]MBH3438418.1 hypothetical protein [Pseudomonas luteola]MDN3235771.1 competence protein ComJ [Pseudomonas sp. WAC2]